MTAAARQCYLFPCAHHLHFTAEISGSWELMIGFVSFQHMSLLLSCSCIIPVEVVGLSISVWACVGRCFGSTEFLFCCAAAEWISEGPKAVG